MSMSLPGVTTKFSVGSLSPVSQAPSIPLVVGPCSGGVINTQVYSFSSPQAIAAAIGDGPAQEWASVLLDDNGGTVQVIVSSGSIPGLNSAVTSGSGVPIITVGGTPYNSYVGQGSITTGGALGAAMFTYSLDGGVNTSPALPVNGTVPLTRTGLTLTFATGSYTAGQTFSFTSQAPQMQSGDLTAALGAITSSAIPSAPVVLVVANDSFSATSGSALFGALDAALNAAQGPRFGRYIGAVFMPTGGPNANHNSAVASATATTAGAFNFDNGTVGALVAERVSCVVPDPFMGYGAPLVPYALELADIETGISPSTNPAWSVVGGNSRFGQNGVGTTWDENVDGDVYELQNIIAPRTLPLKGSVIYPNRGILKQAPGSSYKYIHWGRPLYLAASVVFQAMQKYLNYTVPTKLDGTGQIQAVAANDIIDDVQGQLNAALINVTNDENTKGYCSSVKFSIDQSNNVLQTSKLNTFVTMVPFATLEQITITLGFSTK